MIAAPHTYRIEWNRIVIDVGYNPYWLKAHDIAHLEISSIVPENAPLPMTETGYRSHFTTVAVIEAAGGAVAFVTKWLETESQRHKWKAGEKARQQLSLF